MNTGTFIKGLSADSYKWILESMDKLYKTFSPIYSKVAQIHSLSEIKGSYFQTTSAIGLSYLDRREEEVPIKAKAITEGFTLYIKKRNYANLLPMTYELKRDWHRPEVQSGVSGFIEGYIKKEGAQLVERTKEKAFADFFLKGGLTAGDADTFNNDTKNNTTGYGNFTYDGKPFLTRSGNNRTAKNGDTYYNCVDLALTGASAYDNLKTMHNLLTATNAKMENGEPYDQTQNKYILVPAQMSTDIKVLLNSTLVPGGNNNDSNELKGEYDIIVNPYLNAQPTAAAIGIRNQGIWMFVDNTPRIVYWVDEPTQTYQGAIIIDLAIGVVNWRPFVATNYPAA